MLLARLYLNPCEHNCQKDILRSYVSISHIVAAILQCFQFEKIVLVGLIILNNSVKVGKVFGLYASDFQSREVIWRIRKTRKRQLVRVIHLSNAD